MRKRITPPKILLTRKWLFWGKHGTLLPVPGFLPGLSFVGSDCLPRDLFTRPHTTTPRSGCANLVPEPDQRLFCDHRFNQITW